MYTLEKYCEYFIWNKGLVDHFFAEGKREVRLLVDDQLLEKIGKSKGISAEDDYTSCFLTCVKDFCANYNKFICREVPNKDNVCQHRDCQYYSANPYSCLKSRDRIDVLAVANHISSKGIKFYEKYKDGNGLICIRRSDDGSLLEHPLPFFAIVIYVILKFDKGEKQKWKDLGENEPRSKECIPELWENIHAYCERFDPNASRYDAAGRRNNDYVGRILYHLPLSAPTRNKIQDAIYKSGAWKWVDSKTFPQLIGIIGNSLKDNDELRRILQDCCSQNDYNGISARNVQAVIDDFDIDIYERGLEDRKQSTDYRKVKVSGEFALGIYFPDEEDEESENSIVLLTTVQQDVNKKGFGINKTDFSIDGYNTSFVKFNGGESVELKDYELKDSEYKISPLRTENVIFFYEYDETLFIQTRIIKPAKSYIIAVREGEEDQFKSWCQETGNSPTPLGKEDTRQLFGNAWSIYYNNGRLSGQYYSQEEGNAGVAESSAIVMKGGIKRSGNTYLINALPYFELPADCEANEIEIYMNLNGESQEEDQDYNRRIIGNKLIIDIKDMPILSEEEAYVDVCLEYEGTCRYHYHACFNVCGQPIRYDSSYLYKYDSFGLATTDENQVVFYGNKIADEQHSESIRGVYTILLKTFESISDDMYFTNLLAACCYSTEHSEITYDKFCKCIGYAATRLSLDIQKKDFIGNVQHMLNKAGILNRDYSARKLQVIAPSFLRVPFSRNQVQDTQLQMLTGCYTRAFVADLLDYCKLHNVGMFTIERTCQRDEEKLLPPVILLDYNFSPEDFCREYGQQCDKTGRYDFPLSLLRVVPSYNDICAKFYFRRYDSELGLEQTSCNSCPRIRIEKTSRALKYRYIENENGEFARINEGLTTWASIYCHHERKTPMVILKGNNNVYIPMTLKLPNYVGRALYLMNLGMPDTKKVFVCNSNVETYYSVFNEYNLHDSNRCETLASKLTGADINETNPFARYAVSSNMTMELYRSNFNGKKQHRDMYLVLKENDSIVAIAYKHKVYLKREGRFYRMGSESDTVNKAMTFLIRESWVFGGQSVGFCSGGGVNFKLVFQLTKETLECPDLSQLNKETIQIL